MSEKDHLQYLLVAPHRVQDDLRQLISEALAAWDVEPINLDTMMAPGDLIVRTLQQAIERADFIVADLRGGNPNVMYEVGFAHALGKFVLPIIQSADQIPSDLAGYQFLIHDPDKPDELRRYLRTWAMHYLSELKKIKT